MARTKRTKSKREAHLHQIQIWYVQGKLQADIAEKLDISQQQVSYDLKELQKRWHKASMQTISEAKSRELAKIDTLEMVYWEAWENSCRVAEIKTQKLKGVLRKYEDEDGKIVSESPAEQVRIQKGQSGDRAGELAAQSGDPRFLQGVERCIQQRCKIMGVESAVKNFNFDIDIASLTVGQLARIASGENPLNVVGAKAD